MTQQTLKEVLAKHIPQKPLQCSESLYDCPFCGGIVTPLFHNYCPKCGQKLEWSEESVHR